MHKIIKIARLELSVLFYSPIAWIILVIIFLQAGLNYTDTLYAQETQQQLERQLTVITRVLFAGDNGMLSALIEYLYLYIPLLTMSIFSREYTSGSIKLLQSSPVTVTQIVLGKFLSIVIYAGLIVGLLSLYAISAYFSIANMDMQFVLFGLLGLFLLICTYSAIGLFMSSLTAYQIVAAISTLALLAFLNYVPALGARYDYIREITHWLSVTSRAEEIVNGLFTSKDLIYFLLVIGFFLGVTILRIVQQREGAGTTKKLAQYTGLIAVLFVIGYISSRPIFTAYYDTTQIHDRTLSLRGQEIAKQITGPIKMVSFVNVLDGKAAYGAPDNRIADQSRFGGYRRFIPQMEMEYIAYYDSIAFLRLDSNETIASKAKKSAEALGFNFKKLLTPAEMKQYPQVASENNTFVRFIEYNGRTIPLRMFDDMIQYPGEGEISAVLLRLLEGPSKLGILAGQGERNISNFKDPEYSIYLNGNAVRASVINQGFKINEITTDSISSFSGDCIIIAAPKQPYTTEQLASIFQYIDNGGNLFLLGDPNSSSFLAPIAQKLGLGFREGTLLQESENFEPDLLRVKFTKEAAENGFSFYDKAVVVMNNTSGIDIINQNLGFKITPLLVTDNTDTWNKVDKFDLSTEKVVFNDKKDQRILIPTAVRLERDINGKTQKIAITGDADFMSNAELNRFNINTVNASFATRLFKWFSNGKYPVSGPKDKAPDVTVSVDRNNINMQKMVFLLIIPAIIGISAAYVLRTRKSK